MLSRFHLIPERYGRTDRQTDGQICYINIVRQCADARLTRDKNRNMNLNYEILCHSRSLTDLSSRAEDQPPPRTNPPFFAALRG